MLNQKNKKEKKVEKTSEAKSNWWTWGDSNSRPPECKSGALPIELQARKNIYYTKRHVGLTSGTTYSLC